MWDKHEWLWAKGGQTGGLNCSSRNIRPYAKPGIFESYLLW